MPDEIFYFKDSEIPEQISGLPPEIFSTLRTGLINETQVEIEYNSPEKSTKRNILPEVLFRSSENWYIAAYCFVRHEQRTFRFDRIISASSTDIKETSFGVADDIRENGIPWGRLPEVFLNDFVTEKKSSGLWLKLQIVQDKNGPEFYIESSHNDREKTIRDFNFDLVHHAECGMTDRVEEDLAAGADINFVSGSGNTPFTAAALRGDLPMLKYLIAHGADPFITPRDGSSALTRAIHRATKMETLCYLIEELKLDINAADRFERTPLFLSVQSGRPDIAAYLIQHGTDVSGKSREGETLLMTAIRNSCREESFKELSQLLLRYGLDINAQDNQGRTALYYAIEKNDINCIEFLLSSGISVFHSDKQGTTPLLFAFKHFNNMKYYEPEIRKPCEQLEKTVRCLVENGADIHASDRHGITPLMLAHGRNLTFLLESGACVNAFDRTGKTVAMYHTRSWTELTQLTKYGADLFARDFDGNDLLMHAPAEYTTIRKLVLTFGLEVSKKNKNGDTLLHLAARDESGQDDDLIKFLIRNGADPFDENNDGDMPVNYFSLEYVYRKRKKLSDSWDWELEEYLRTSRRPGKEKRFFVQEQGLQ